MNAALDPAGPQAAHIAQLWWLTLALCVVVFVVVSGKTTENRITIIGGSQSTVARTIASLHCHPSLTRQ